MFDKNLVYKELAKSSLKTLGVTTLVLSSLIGMGYSCYDFTLGFASDQSKFVRGQINKQIECYRKLHPLENLDCTEETFRQRDNDLSTLVLNSKVDYCRDLE